MSKFIWAGQSFNVTIGNKQRDNTGIRNIVFAAFQNSTLSDFLTTDSSIPSNNEPANITASVGVFNTNSTCTRQYLNFTDLNNIDGIGVDNNNAYNEIYVNWKGGGRTDVHHVNGLFIAKPITDVTINADSTEIWSDVGAYVSASTTTINSFKGNNTAYVDFTSSNTGIYASAPAYSAVMGETIWLVPANTATISGSTTFKITGTTLAGSPNEKGVAAAVSYSATTSDITVKNSVTSVTLNGSVDSTIYVTNGGDAEVSYTVVAHHPGTPYSYTTSIVSGKSPNTTIATVSSTSAQALNSSHAGTFVIHGKQVGTTSLQIKSDQSSFARISPLLTIIVMPASTSVYLNPGDTYTATIPTGAQVSTGYSDYDPDIASGSINGTTLTITAGTTAGTSKVKIVAGGAETIYTVQVEHITVSVS